MSGQWTFDIFRGNPKHGIRNPETETETETDPETETETIEDYCNNPE